MTPALARYWRDVGGVLGGSFIAQLIPIAASLAIARLVTPSVYGEYAAWLGVVVVAAAFLTLRYEVAIPLEQRAAGRLNAALATLALVVVVALAIGLPLLGCALVGAVPGLSVLAVALGLAVAVLLASSTVLQLWLGAEGHFAELSRMRVIQACGLSGSQVLASWIAPSATSLSVGVGVGAAMALIYAFARPMRKDVAALQPGEGIGAAWGFLSRRRRFAIVSLPAALLGTAAEQLPVLLVTSRFGSDSGGQLALAMRTLGAAAGLVTAAVLDVFRRDSSSAYAARRECREAFDRSLKVLCVAAAALVAIVAPSAEPLFGWVFGDAWLQAGTVARWLLPLIALRIVAGPLSYMYFVAERQGVDLVWQVVVLAFTIVSLSAIEGHAPSIQAFSWGYAGLYTVYLMFAFRLSRGAAEMGERTFR